MTVHAVLSYAASNGVRPRDLIDVLGWATHSAGLVEVRPGGPDALGSVTLTPFALSGAWRADGGIAAQP